MRTVVVSADFGHRTRVIGLLDDPAEDFLIGWMQMYLNDISPGMPRPHALMTSEFTEFGRSTGMNNMVYAVDPTIDGPWGGAVRP